jgi:hypothetical protein
MLLLLDMALERNIVIALVFIACELLLLLLLVVLVLLLHRLELRRALCSHVYPHELKRGIWSQTDSLAVDELLRCVLRQMQ